MQGLLLELPSGYYLECEPGLLVLRRLDGSMVGIFSARGAVSEVVQGTLQLREEAATRDNCRPRRRSKEVTE
jgi:hypothetical protein